MTKESSVNRIERGEKNRAHRLGTPGEEVINKLGDLKRGGTHELEMARGGKVNEQTRREYVRQHTN